MTRKINRIYVHCSASTFGTIEWIDAIHRKERGWLKIGYHFLITNGKAAKNATYNPDEDGKVYPGRKEEDVGAHVKGDNATSLGICLIGVDEFTDKQLAALEDLLALLCVKYSIPPSEIKGHREYWEDRHQAPEKECPGFAVSDLRKRISERLT